jgi:hypothetical protein
MSFLVRSRPTAPAKSVEPKGIDVHRRAVTRIIRTAGAEVRYRIDADLETARYLYDSGASLGTAGKAFEVSARKILNMLRQAGIPRRPVGSNQWG